jgi:hypothetical protein
LFSKDSKFTSGLLGLTRLVLIILMQGLIIIWKWAKDEMGNKKSLIMFSQNYQRVKTVIAVGYPGMSVIPLLLMGIVTKGKLSAIFIE